MIRSVPNRDDRGGLPRLRVCQIHFGGPFGGAERLFVDLSTELQERDVKVLAVCHPQTRIFEELRSRNLTVFGLKERSSRDPICAWRLRKAVARFNADVVHAHLSRATRISTQARVNSPVISSIHNYGRWKYYRDADFFMPVTRFGDRYVRDQGVEPNRIQMVPYFTRLPLRNQVKPMIGQSVRLVAYGRFVIEKGFQDLLRACALLRARGLEFELILGGTGPYEHELRQLVGSLGLGDSVQFVGWIDDVAEVLDAADLFVLPSRIEPFGIVLLEAMARRVPLVCTRAEGPAELLSDDHAFFSPINDPSGLASAILEAALDPARTRAKAEQAHELCKERYIPSAVVDNVIDRYQRLATVAAGR